MPGTEGLPVLVFSAVVTTILIFAAGFPLLKRRLLAAQPVAPPDDPATTEGITG